MVAVPTDSMRTLDGLVPMNSSASCNATWSGATANRPPSAYRRSPTFTHGKNAGAAQVARVTSTALRASSPSEAWACGVLNTLVTLRDTSTAGTTTACKASPSVRSPKWCVSSRRSASPVYLGPSTERVRSMSRVTVLPGRRREENTSSPRSTNSLTMCAIGTSKASAIASSPPTEVPAIRSKRRASGSPTRASRSASTTAVYRPRYPPPLRDRMRNSDDGFLEAMRKKRGNVNMPSIDRIAAYRNADGTGLRDGDSTLLPRWPPQRATPASIPGLVLQQPGRQLVGRHGARVVVALGLMAMIEIQEAGQLGGLHALGDDLQLEAARHADDGAHDGGLIRAADGGAPERLGDLALVHREPLEVGQA